MPTSAFRVNQGAFGRSVWRRRKAAQGPIRNAHAEADEGDFDLPPDQEPARGPTASRTYQAGKLGIEVNDALEMAEQTEV